MLTDYNLVLLILGIFLVLIIFYNLLNGLGLGLGLGLDKQEKKISEEPTPTYKTYTLETMSNPIDSFCDHYETIPSELKSEAEKLTKDNCMNSRCTIWLKSLENKKCVAGNASGPTYLTENGTKIHVDNYYYMNKKYPLKT